jgi:hypothetical protein
MWASLMRLLHFVAMRTLAERGLGEEVVGAARAGSTL